MERFDPPKPAKVPDTVTRVSYMCDACLMGEMIPTNTIFTTDPPKYEHACNACGVRKALDRTYPYSKVTYKEGETLETAQRQRGLLAEALGKVLVAAGMVRADAAMTGPELLLAADTFCNPGVDHYEEMILERGATVPRDDGRFYVPVDRTMIRVNDDRSQTVLRVASDAFDVLSDAEEFAQDIVDTWNAARRKPA